METPNNLVCPSLFLYIVLCFLLLGHQNCIKFQKFMLEEFGRLFKLYSDLQKKETETNEKLIRSMERIDELEYEVATLNDELSEFRFAEFDSY
jgi:hypothetical protein